MPNYDDLFTGQPAPQEEFNKDAWAAKKQAERESVYAMIDSHVHDMGMEAACSKPIWTCRPALTSTP